MKKQLLLIFSSFCFGAFVMAQDEITMNLVGNTDDISGTTITETSTGSEVHVEVEVFNTSSMAKTWYVTRLELNQSMNWTNNLCWGPNPDPNFEGICYGVSQMATNPWTTPNSVTIPAGGSGKLIVYVTPNDNSGSGSYKYYISENGTSYDDSLQINVSSTASVKDMKSTPSLTVAPNPASDNLMISAPGVDQGTIKVVDVLGNMILNESFNGSRKLNVESFRNGVYFVIIEGNGIQSVNRKFVVRH